MPTTSARTPATPPPSRSRAWVFAAAAVGVAVIALIAAVSTRGGDDGETSTPSGSSAPRASDDSPSPVDSRGPGSTQGPAVPGAVAPAESQPVTVVGDPLERLPQSGADPAVGEQAPVLSGFGFDGTPIEVESADGEPVLVVVFAHWCPHCNAEVPRLVQWNESGRVPEDLRIVGVSTAARAGQPFYPPSQWVVDEAWPWPVLADSREQTAAAALGVSGYPFMTVIGGDGSVLARHSGELRSVDAIDAFVRDALGT